MKRSDFIFLLLITYTNQLVNEKPETSQEKVIGKLLGENVIKVRTDVRAEVLLYSKWIDQALSSLMAAVAQEQLKLSTKSAIIRHQNCAKAANSIKKHAKCVVKLLDSHKGQKFPKYLSMKDIPIHRIKRKTEDLISTSLSDSPLVVTKDSYSLQSSQSENIFNSITNMVTKVVRKGKGKEHRKSWNMIYTAILEQKKRIDREKLLSGTVLNSLNFKKKDVSGPYKMNPEQRAMMNILKEGVNLGLKITGQNGTAQDETLRLASPRLLSIVPEQNSEKNILSPSLFSLHDKGEGIEKELSLSGLLKKIDKAAPNHLLEMITEVTGLSDIVEEAERKAAEKPVGTMSNSHGKAVSISKENMTSLYGEDGYRTLKVLERLHSSYTDDQVEAMNTTGFIVMNNKQLELMYGKGSPFEDEEVIMRNKNLKSNVARKEIIKAIRHFASGKASFSHRMKDFVLSPLLKTAFISKPTSGVNLILSPAVLSPLILSPAIFGAVILSPWVFVPLVLSPRAFSPVVLSPFLFSPLILSPFLGNPLVLSPGVANPLILSPAVLNPVILSPQVLTPVILSPLALSPVILSPFTLSPFILSPFVLTPVVLSPSILGGLVLSPYALSPIIASPPIGGGIIFGSPSFLS